MHPIDHISIAALYSFSRRMTSGARYHRVTTWPVSSRLIEVFEANLFYLTNGGYFNERDGILLNEGVANLGVSRLLTKNSYCDAIFLDPL